MRLAALCLVSLVSMAAAGQDAAPPPVIPPALLQHTQPSGESCKYSGSRTAVLALTVNLQGTPEDETVAISSGNACLDAQALKALAQYRFRPATRAGQAVSTRLRISVNFRKY